MSRANQATRPAALLHVSWRHRPRRQDGPHAPGTGSSGAVPSAQLQRACWPARRSRPGASPAPPPGASWTPGIRDAGSDRAGCASVPERARGAPGGRTPPKRSRPRRACARTAATRAGTFASRPRAQPHGDAAPRLPSRTTTATASGSRRYGPVRQRARPPAESRGASTARSSAPRAQRSRPATTAATTPGARAFRVGARTPVCDGESDVPSPPRSCSAQPRGELGRASHGRRAMRHRGWRLRAPPQPIATKPYRPGSPTTRSESTSSAAGKRARATPSIGGWPPHRSRHRIFFGPRPSAPDPQRTRDPPV